MKKVKTILGMIHWFLFEKTIKDLMILPMAESQVKGAYGRYYNLGNGTGIKVLYDWEFKTYYEAKESLAMHHAKLELEHLNIAEPSGLVPKGIGIKIAKQKGKYMVGIIMEHLDGVTLAESGIESKDTVCHQLKYKLREYGIRHDDMHEHNVMVVQGKCYAIDFGSNSVGRCEPDNKQAA